MRATEPGTVQMQSRTFELALFPLQTVLFPDGLLSLKVFEARYLDLVAGCVREGTPFGVVALRQGSEVRKGDTATVFETTGTLAELIEVDSAQAGILQVRCRGTQRFAVLDSRQQSDGLWLAEATTLPIDEPDAPPEAMAGTVKGLANAIATLKAQNQAPFLEPYRFDKAGWVANRWCEILPISLAAKQKLMELSDPMVRLQLVDEFLRSKGVVS
jgi:Lon protease-like protein